MIVDHARGRVWLDARDHGDPPGLALLDPGAGTVEPVPEFSGHHVVGLSADGTLLALAGDVVAYGTNKSDLVVRHVPTGEVRLRTRRHLVYAVAFAPDGGHALVEAYNSRPRRYRLAGEDQDLGPVRAGFRMYAGEQDPVSGRFVAPAEKGRLLATDIGAGDVEDVRLPLTASVGAVRFSPDGKHVFTADHEDVVTCFTRDWSPVWRTSFAGLPDEPSGIWSGGLFVPSGGGLVGVSAGETKANGWGTDYVLDAADGRLLRRIENYQGRGRIKTAYLGTRVLLHGGFELDLHTGELGRR
ncbi:MAG: hypothetical protein SYR96_18985 [Actinomycetota bacterium]|nr:hypothetical protein [Actinomycetota bacterium]